MSPSLPVLDLMLIGAPAAAAAAPSTGEFLAVLDGFLSMALESEERARLGAVAAPVPFLSQPVAAQVTSELPVAVAPACLPAIDKDNASVAVSAAEIRVEAAPQPLSEHSAQEIDAPAEVRVEPEIVAAVREPEGPFPDPASPKPERAARPAPEVRVVAPLPDVGGELPRVPADAPRVDAGPAEAPEPAQPCGGEPEAVGMPRTGSIEAVEDSPAGEAPTPARPAAGGSGAPEARMNEAVPMAPALLRPASREIPRAPERPKPAPAVTASDEAVAAAPRQGTVRAVERPAEAVAPELRVPRREVAFAARAVEVPARKTERETRGVETSVTPPVEPRMPVAANGASEAAPTAAVESIEPAPAAGPATPARQVSVNLGENVRVKVSGQGSEVRVVVHSPDRVLNESLRERLPELVERLETRGFATETWQPAAAAASRSGSEMSSDSGARDRQPSGGGQQQNQRERRHAQDVPEWLEELERSKRQ